MSLEGFLPADDSLSPRAAFRRLRPAIRGLLAHEPTSIWEHDTKALPRALQTYRKTVKAFADEELRPHALEVDLAPDTVIPQRVLKVAAAAGLLSDLLPTPFGTMSAGLLRYPIQWIQAIKMEELCTACAGLGLLIGAHGLGTIPLILSGDWRVIRRFVLPAYRRSKAGDPVVFAFAITEPGAGSDAEDSRGATACTPATIAQQTDGGWRLNGRKVFISGGDIAEAVTVFAALDGEGMASWTCFVVKKDMPGFSVVRTEAKMGQRASGAAELLFEDVFVPEDHVVGGLRNGWAINRAALNLSRIPVGAIALGVARGALESAMSFASRHMLGGKALIHYQEVQLSIAQMVAETSAMRALIWDSARTFTPMQAKSSLTKFYCGDAAMRVCEAAMELMGNHGLLHANDNEKRLRDARLTQIYEGTNEINRLAVIEDLQEDILQQMTEQGVE